MGARSSREFRTHRVRVAVLAVLAVATASCGSTVQVGVNGQPLVDPQAGAVAATPGAVAPSELAANDGLGLPGVSSGGEVAVGGTSAAGGTGTAGAAAAPVADGGGGGGKAAGSGSGPGARVRPGTRAPAARGGAQPGLTGEEIKIGIIVTRDAGAANESAGVEGGSGGDQRGYAETMVKWVNANGGVFGRKVVPVFHTYDGGSTQSIAEQEQAACATFTQDNEVFAVASSGEPTLVSCLHQAGVPQFSTQGMRSTQEDILAQFPSYFEIASMELNTVSRSQIEGLYREKYFAPRNPTEVVKIGLVRYDEPGFKRATAEAFKPALAQRGLRLTDEAEITTPQGLNDYGSVVAQIQNAILRFQGAGINRVMFMESSGDLALFWMQSAEAQGYRPRYGLTSNDAGELLADNVPHAQLVDAKGVGWSPGYDTRGKHALPDWPAVKLCEGIYRKAGFEFADINARGVAMLYCDGLRFTQAAANRSPSGATRAGIVAGAERLGTSYQSASGNGSTRYSRTRHFGVAAYRTLAWYTDCECFKYTNGARPFPTPS